MSDWKAVLKADPTEWLLEEENPSVRYFALTEILDKPLNDSQVQKAKNAVMTTGVVPEILAKQSPDGSWEKPFCFYTAKYKGTVWQLIILAELGADAEEPRVKRACEFMLANSQEKANGGFSMATAQKTGGGRASEVIPCLTGNMVWSLIRLGYLQDNKVQAGVNWIATYQRFDDAEGPAPTGELYDRYEMCWGKHSCHMGAAKALKALAEIPQNQRSSNIEATIRTGAEYFLKHHIYKQSHNLNKVSKPGWLRFGFPLMYQTDALEVLGILAKLGYKDPRMQEAVDLVVSKQSAEGRWKLENTYNDRFQVGIERKGEDSKWVTLNALKALKKFYGSSM